MVLVVVLALLPCAGVGKGEATLDKQLVQAAARGDLGPLKTLLQRAAALHPEDDGGGVGRVERAGVPSNPVSGKRWGGPGSTLPLDRGQQLAATSEADKPGPSTAPSDKDAATDAGPTASIPPYEEKKRITIPDTFGAGQGCYAAAYEAITADELEDLDMAALVCFSCKKGMVARTCFEARSDFWHHQFHQFIDCLEIVPILSDRQPHEGILFVARARAGPIVWYTKLITLWVYRKECGQFINLLPEIRIGWSDEFKFLSDSKGKHDGVLVVAKDAEERETRQDRSAYLIRIYRYGHKEKKFQPIVGGEFLTEKKYYFKLEGEGTTEIIDEQMDKIRQLLDQTGDETGSP
jgi:hypothetical protein